MLFKSNLMYFRFRKGERNTLRPFLEPISHYFKMLGNTTFDRSIMPSFVFLSYDWMITVWGGSLVNGNFTDRGPWFWASICQLSILYSAMDTFCSVLKIHWGSIPSLMDEWMDGLTLRKEIGMSLACKWMQGYVGYIEVSETHINFTCCWGERGHSYLRSITTRTN